MHILNDIQKLWTNVKIQRQQTNQCVRPSEFIGIHCDINTIIDKSTFKQENNVLIFHKGKYFPVW